MHGKHNRHDLCPVCGKKIKHCSGHRSILTKATVLGGMLSVVFIAAVIVFLRLQTGQPTVSTTDTPETPGVDNYQAILSKVTQEKISGVYTPVFLFCNNSFWASGVRWESPRGWRIVTTAHNFPEGKSGYYSYQVLRPFDEKLHPINRLEVPKGDGTYQDGIDVMLCVPGPQQIIHGLEGYTLGGATNRTVDLKFARPSPPYSGMQFTSLLTGKTFPCVGNAVSDIPGTNLVRIGSLVLPDHTMAGMSGSGYLSSDGGILILNGSADIPTAVARKLGIEGVSHISVGAYMRADWSSGR